VIRLVIGALLAAWSSAAALAQDVAQTVAQDVNQTETECDRLAGLWLLPRVEGMAQVYAITDPAPAIAACEAAMATDPDTAFFAVLLARALLVQDPQSARVIALLDGAAEALPALVSGQFGALYENGMAGLAASERSARNFYRAACDDWPERLARPGCAGLALMKIEGRGGPADETGGFAMLDNLCRSGWAMACTTRALQQELRGTATEPQIAQMLVQACEAGGLLGCSLLGFRYETELGVPYDMSRARALYERACEGGEMHGCANLGEVYRSGYGVAPDVPRAVALFERACDGNDPFACMALGDILANGRGVPVDVARAIVVLDRACWLGDPIACDDADMLR